MVNKKRNININLYPQKWEEFLRKYNFEEAVEQYWKYCRVFSLEKCVLKYGEEEGKKKYEEKRKNIKNSGVTLQKYILKYGEESGIKKYEDWKVNVKQDLNNFIKKHGEEEGYKKWEDFKKKACKNLRINKSEENYNTNLKYWIKKNNGDIEKAKKEYKERQTTSSLEKMIKKYGEEEGKKKYQEINLKKSLSIENFVKKYGEEGERRYFLYIEKIKEVRKKEYFIKKHGEEWYKDYIIRKTTKNNTKRYSNVGFEFCEALFQKIRDEYLEIYYGDNEYSFFVFEDDIKIVQVDFYIKQLNCVVEFYGDYWHKNPNKFFDDKSLEIRKRDEKRLKKLEEKFGCNIFVVWENDYIKNKVEKINQIIVKIKSLKNGNC